MSEKEKELSEHDKLFEARDAFDDSTTTVLWKEQAAHDKALLDHDATRMTNDRLDESATGDKKLKEGVTISKKLGYNRFMVEDMWKVGSARLHKYCIGKKREHAVARLVRKSTMASAINAAKDSIFKPELELTIPEWKNHISSSFP